jgi:hypothetical protein
VNRVAPFGVWNTRNAEISDRLKIAQRIFNDLGPNVLATGDDEIAVAPFNTENALFGY